MGCGGCPQGVQGIRPDRGRQIRAIPLARTQDERLRPHRTTGDLGQDRLGDSGWATGTGSAGCGLVALLFTEKLLNLFAAGPFLVVNFPSPFLSKF